MRTYDATGMGFLQNYIGESHAQLLAALPERHAVVFGTASSCNAPIILKLNDADDLRAGFWDERVGSLPVTRGPEVPPAVPADDELPF